MMSGCGSFRAGTSLFSSRTSRARPGWCRSGASVTPDDLAEHRLVLRKVFERHGGVEVDTQAMPSRRLHACLRCRRRRRGSPTRPRDPRSNRDPHRPADAHGRRLRRRRRPPCRAHLRSRPRRPGHPLSTRACRWLCRQGPRLAPAQRPAGAGAAVPVGRAGVSPASITERDQLASAAQPARGQGARARTAASASPGRRRPPYPDRPRG